MIRRASVALLLILVSCAGALRRPQRISVDTEITDHPEILYNNTIPREEMSLRRIKLGDAESAIRSSRIVNRNAGWIACDDGARYRVENGVVVTLGLWDSPWLAAKLGLNSPADIEARFGKPEKVDDINPLKIYRYAGGKVSVIWNMHEGQINAVNVTR